ncbi:MAG: M56 family metallopeptidase, partial [Planctomycetota bacterium]|nr:M56 family metallopeptidase [Planctomycetota bacterium]
MNCFIVISTAALGTSSLLLVDSAIKGGALLLLAALVVLLLRRDSAATRHLVWQVSIVGMLVVPVFSAVLPAWRVLPQWAVLSEPTGPTTTQSVAEGHPASAFTPQVASDIVTGRPSPDPTPAVIASVTPQPVTAQLPRTEPLVSSADAVTTEPPPESPPFEPAWLTALPVVWLIGFSVLILRLLAARLILWSGERRGSVMVDSQHARPADRSLNSVDSAIVNAFQAACRQLAVVRPVRLLMHAERTIPVVWGIFQLRLLLPDAARTWSPEQLQSVLLHELAHIKRRDSIAQLLAQVACALHWFNPLVWFASWRLHVERERACDDLVLASGVRPSEYAEHLLDIATRLAPARWTQACGLAMARKSSLEGRLVAVLSQRSNRRSVSASVVALAMIAGVGVTVPVAMLHPTEAAMPEAAMPEAAMPEAAMPEADNVGPADDEEQDQTTAQHTDRDTTNPPSAAELQPDHEDARSLFRIWQANARTDGKIPGAWVGQLGEWVQYFIELNDGSELSAKFTTLLPRFDAAHDWTQTEAVALLDNVGAVHRIPLR